MDYMTELSAIAKTHGGIIETKIAAQRGISKAVLYKLCKENRIHRMAGRTCYAAAGTLPLSPEDYQFLQSEVLPRTADRYDKRP